MTPISFLNAMNDLPDSLIAEADILPAAPAASGAGKKDNRGPSFLSAPWFAVAAGLVVAFIVVALIVRAGRSGPGNTPVPPADSLTSVSEAETGTVTDTDTEPETGAREQNGPVTLTVEPLRLTEGCTEITVRITHTKQSGKLLLTPVFRLTRIMAFDADERLSQVSQDVPVTNEAVSYGALPAYPNGYASLTVTIHVSAGLTPGEYRLELTDGTDRGNETAPSVCTFAVGFANDSDDPKCAYCRSTRFTVIGGTCAIHPMEHFQHGEVYNRDYDVWENMSGTVFDENLQSRLTAPCIGREGLITITNDMPRDTELKALSVIDVATGEIVLTGNDEPGGFPRTLAPGQSLTLTSLGTLPGGTYAVCMENPDMIEYVEAAGQWSRADYTLVFYVTVPSAEKTVPDGEGGTE